MRIAKHFDYVNKGLSQKDQRLTVNYQMLARLYVSTVVTHLLFPFSKG